MPCHAMPCHASDVALQPPDVDQHGRRSQFGE
jgi:hypothetical protein